MRCTCNAGAGRKEFDAHIITWLFLRASILGCGDLELVIQDLHYPVWVLDIVLADDSAAVPHSGLAPVAFHAHAGSVHVVGPARPASRATSRLTRTTWTTTPATRRS
jgi:hypothetical protein